MTRDVVQAEASGGFLAPGTEPVPGYRLVRRLGVGGSGEVWSAEGPGGFPVALKIIRLEASRAAAHFRGLEVARAVRHPNLLGGFGAWADDERLILALELADGSLWDRFLEARAEGLPGIPRDELIGALDEAARGVDYLNEHRHGAGDRAGLGIQHRDLKPQNILLVGGGVKVADFGAARWMEESVTGHTGLQWTPAYAAPEFFLGATARQSDQYSLAVTYCHLRTGRLPFAGDPAFVMAGHLMRAPDLSRLDEPERVVVARALAKRPEDRWPSCRAFMEALRAAVGRCRATAPGPVVKACLVWPRQVVGSLAEVPPVMAYAAGGPGPADDPDDSAWDDELPSLDTVDVPPKDLGPVVAPDSVEEYAPDTRATLRSDPARRRRQAMVMASLVVIGALALWTSGLLHGHVPARSTARRPRPPALALHSSPPPPIAPIRDRPERAIATPDSPRPEPPAEAFGSRGRAGGAPDVTRRVALRPVTPGPPARSAAAEPPSPRRPGDARRLIVEGFGRTLGRLMIPLVANPTAAPHAPAAVAAPGHPEAVAGAEIEPSAVPCEEPRDAFEDGTAEPPRDDPPSAAEAAKRRGDAHLGRGELDAAIAGYSEAIRFDPKLAGAYAGRGEVLERKGDHARAIADLDAALRLRPGSAPALNDRGLAALGLGDVFRAIADLDAALRAAPGSAVIHYNRGIAYARLGDPGVALAEFDAALRLDPGLAVARSARAHVPARQVALTRAVSRPSRPAQVSPPRPVPSGTGVLPTPQDDRPTPMPPAPPVPSLVPPRGVPGPARPSS